MSGKPAASTPQWWQLDALIIFGITVPVMPTLFALAALWVGREIARDPRRKMTAREKVFLNIGLTLVTFLVVTGKLFGGDPLEIGWATVWGFGIGMNGLVIFEIFQRFTYGVVSNAMRGPEPPRHDDERTQ